MSADWYHCQLKPIRRSQMRSAVACAAYRTGTALEDEHYGMLRDFSRKSVVTHFTLAPEESPEWASDVTQLWNHVEERENRINSTLSFEWEVALPNELDDARRENIARTFAAWIVEEYRVPCTVGIHSGGERGNGMNDHLHLMMATRPVNEDGWDSHKLRAFNTAPGRENPEVERVREHVAEIINSALDEAGFDGTHHVTHLSYAARGIDQTATVHLGPGANGYKSRGVDTQRDAQNRAIIEERLAWQQHQAMPDITADLEREFTARFGDEPRPGLNVEPLSERRDLASQPPPSAPDELTAEPASTAAAGTPRRVTPWGRAWRTFADRARSFAAGVAAFLADESGTPEPVAEIEPAQEAPPPPSEQPSLWQRFVTAERSLGNAARDLWHNERGSVPASGNTEGGLFAAFLASKPQATPPPQYEDPPETTPVPAPSVPRPPEPDGPDYS